MFKVNFWNIIFKGEGKLSESEARVFFVQIAEAV